MHPRGRSRSAFTRPARSVIHWDDDDERRAEALATTATTAHLRERVAQLRQESSSLDTLPDAPLATAARSRGERSRLQLLCH